MEQARHYVCESCGTHVPRGHKFCGSCGTPVPSEVLESKIEYFGPMQMPGRARLVVIRGEGNIEGLSYLLQGDEHLVGRDDGEILFPDDPWISSPHARFYYRGSELFVSDEQSTNGVYIRVQGTVPLQAGDHFLCGQQLFRLDAEPEEDSGPSEDGTFFYSSPRRPSIFRIVQIVEGGDIGMVCCARDGSVLIGRDDCDMNFPEDLYMSSNHARIETAEDGQFALADHQSKNGTYMRIRGEEKLADSDYLFVGRQLLRVEVTQ